MTKFDIGSFESFDALLTTLIADAERLSGLSAKGAPLPVVIDGAYDPNAAQALHNDMSAGMYFDRTSVPSKQTGNRGVLIFNHDIANDGDALNPASTIVHELVHWLQDVNGKTVSGRESKDTIRAIELEATSVQAKWLREKGFDPADKYPGAMQPAFFAQMYGGETPVW